MKKGINNQNKHNLPQSCSNEKLSFGFGPFRVRAHGLKPLKLLGWGAGIALGAWGLYRLVDGLIDESQSKASAEQEIKVADSKSANTINEHHEASQDRRAEDDNHTDNDIRRAQAMSDIRMNERRQMEDMREAKKSGTNNPTKNNVSFKEWIDCFHANFPMPDYSSIKFLASILDGCPDDYKDAMMMSLLSEFGSLCFSKVRALYLDNRLHSPSIQVIVEGEQGSGKGKILHLYECLFGRVIDSDREKLRLQVASDKIIQTAGINISQAKFYEVVANNQGVHSLAVESEITTVENAFKKSNGLSFDFLRKAFHNEPIYLNNKAKGTVHGSFPVFLNYIFTGTPKAIGSLINAKEVEGGTASRICFAVIPEVELMAPFVDFPSGSELNDTQDQIDSWRQKYCFQTVAGKDVACQEHEIYIDYICDALQDWLNKQYQLYIKDGVQERNDVRMRMATIAFHCAIVLHMLAGEPKPNDRKLRKTVKELTIYIANYCMERYLTKFTDYGLQVQANEATTDNSDSTAAAPVRRKLTQEEIDEWYYLRGTLDENGKTIGYGTIGKKLGVDKYSVKNSFDRYKKKMGLK